MLDPKMEKLLPRASALMDDWGAAHKSIDTIKVIARNNFGFKADALDLLEREAPSDYHDAGSNVFKVIAEIENQLKNIVPPPPLLPASQVSQISPESLVLAFIGVIAAGVLWIGIFDFALWLFLLIVLALGGLAWYYNEDLS